jgi:hypothetical protein
MSDRIERARCNWPVLLLVSRSIRHDLNETRSIMKSIIKRLLAIHRTLDREVSRELAHPRPDQMRLARLKRERLATKDRLAFVTAKASAVSAVAHDMLANRRGPRTAHG